MNRINPPARFLAAAATAFLLLSSGGCASSARNARPAVTEQSEADARFQAGAKLPPSSKTLYALSQILAAQGKDPQARFLLRKIIDQTPDFLPAYCDLAELEMRERHIDDAVRILDAGLKCAPNETILINDRGMCMIMLDRYGEALKMFTRACGLAPDDHRYRGNMATALGLVGRYDESFSLYLDVMSPSDAHFNLAILCDARHDAQRARDEYNRAGVPIPIKAASPQKNGRRANMAPTTAPSEHES